MGLTNTPKTLAYLFNKMYDPVTDSMKVLGDLAPPEMQRIKEAADTVKTITWTTSSKDSLLKIEWVSASEEQKVTETFDDSGETTTILTRTIEDI